MGRKKKFENQPTGGWQQIYNILKELFITAYKWEGLPETVNQRFLELSLFDYGKVVFFKDDVMDDFLALKATLASDLDVYYEPKLVHAYGGNGYQKTLANHKDAVVVYNNFVRDTPQVRIMDYAKRIYNIERTIDINIHAQKTPVLIKTNKKQEFTLKNLYMQYDEYQPVIVVDDEMDPSKISAITTQAPYVADKLEEQKRKLWNEALSYIGVENNFSEKNERLTKNEVLVSNGLAIANRNSKLQARQIAADEINKIFGLSISVTVNNLSYLEFEGDEEGGGDFE